MNNQKLREELERAMKAGSKEEARRIAEDAFNKYIDYENENEEQVLLQFIMFYMSICQKEKLERESALIQNIRRIQR